MKAWALYFDVPVPYSLGDRVQDRLLDARAREEIPDTVLFLEHEPVITLGRRGRDQFLLASRRELERRGIALATASRGGDITYHEPGQLVMYPILRLGAREADAHGYLANLEDIAVRTAAGFQVKACRREGMNGAWTAQGKIAAIGFRLKRWVTSHGMSFNVDPDLAAFDLIVGCGLVGEPVSSLRAMLGKGCPSMAEVRSVMTSAFRDVCGRDLLVHEHRAEWPSAVRDVLPEGLRRL